MTKAEAHRVLDLACRKPASSVFEWAGSCRVTDEKIPYQRFVVQRSHKGADNQNARLTRDQVLEICRRYDALGHVSNRNATGRLHHGDVSRIADDYGVTRQCVRKIATGHLWSSVTGRTPKKVAARPSKTVNWPALKRLAAESRAHLEG